MSQEVPFCLAALSTSYSADFNRALCCTARAFSSSKLCAGCWAIAGSASKSGKRVSVFGVFITIVLNDFLDFPNREYSTGSTNKVSSVADTNPPITTVANGRCTSAPAPGNSHGEESHRRRSRGEQHRPKPVGRSFFHQFVVVVVALFFKVFVVLNQNDSVQNRNSEQGDESDPGGNTERHIAEPEDEYSSHRRQGDGRKDQQRVAHGVKSEVQQHENQQQSDRHGDKQTVDGALHVFELTTVAYAVPRRQGDVFIDQRSHVVDHRLQIAVPHVDAHHHPPSSVVPGYLGRPFVIGD